MTYVSTYVIRCPNNMTHGGGGGGAQRDRKQSLGLQPQLQWLSKWFRQGRRNDGESRDVLCRWALGNIPPMPVPHEAGKWRKSDTSLRSPLVSLLIQAHPRPVSCDLGKVSGSPGLLSLGCSTSRVWTTEVPAPFLPLPDMLLCVSYLASLNFSSFLHITRNKIPNLTWWLWKCSELKSKPGDS